MMTRRYSHLTAVAILIAACSAPIFAQQETIDELRVKADQGDADAQFNLGIMYANGRGVPQDDAEAVRWYRLAAGQGLVGAQYRLGVMYGNGDDVPQDDAEAVQWYRLAAEQGLALAMNRLGIMYLDGRGVPQDYVLAHMWYNLAASRIDDSIMRRLTVQNRDYVVEQMTPNQLAEAQRLAREWDAAHPRGPRPR